VPETPTLKLPYPQGSDDNFPPADFQALAEAVEEQLLDVPLSQIAVPGGSDGKLVIVKDGAAAFAAMSGDGMIDEDGVFQLGSKVVGTSELGDKAVTTGKVDDKAITLGKLAEALGLPNAYLANPIVSGRVASNGNITLGTGFTVEIGGTGLYLVKLTAARSTNLVPMVASAEAKRIVRVDGNATNQEFVVKTESITTEAAASADFLFWVRASE